MSKIYFDTRASRTHVAKPISNPYFVNMASHRRMCPFCHSTTVWSGTLDPDVAMESCPKCGWFQTRVAEGSFEGARCPPVGAESALPVDLEMDEALRTRRLGGKVVSYGPHNPPKRGEVIQFRPRG